MSELRTLVIRSSEWLRGIGPQASYLFDGKRYCCLGLDARDCGVEEHRLINVKYPWQISRDKAENVNHWLTRIAQSTSYIGNKHCSPAMMINDDKTTTDEQKIDLLRPIFREVGVEIDWRPNE